METISSSNYRKTNNSINTRNIEASSNSEPGKFSNKYKDVLPEDTIKNIIRFFKSFKESYSVHEEVINSFSSDIFSCVIVLYDGKDEVIRSNGKGASLLFARASGYAELYERFCTLHIFKEKLAEEIIYEKKSRKIAIQDAIKAFPILEEFKRKELLKDTFEFLFDDLHVLPFKSICDEKEIDISPLLLINVCGSNGMAAGNTKEEALVQGICEVFERYIEKKVFFGDAKLRKIDEELLNKLSSEISNWKRQLEEKNISIEFFDASYDSGLPVVVSFTVDRNTNTHYVNIGSSPILEIAIERTITETFQGVGSLETVGEKFVRNNLFTNCSLSSYEQFVISGSEICSEDSFLTNQVITDKNTKAYCEKEYDNAKQLEWVAKIIKDSKVDLYYYDASLSKDISAVWCYSPQLSNIMIEENEEFSENSKELITQIKNYLEKENNSFSDAMDLLTSLRTTKIATRTLYDMYDKAPVSSSIIEYLICVLSFKTSESCNDIVSEGIKDSISYKYPKFNILRTYESCVEADKKEEIRRLFSIYKYDEKYIKILEEKGADFEKEFIKDAFYGELTRKNEEKTRAMLLRASKIKGEMR